MLIRKNTSQHIVCWYGNYMSMIIRAFMSVALIANFGGLNPIILIANEDQFR